MAERKRNKKEEGEEGKEGSDRKEDFEVGRILGIIARKDPELYDRIKSYAESTGVKLTDVIYEALELYDEYSQLSMVDIKCVMASLRLLDSLLRRLANMMFALNQFFTTEFFRTQIDTLYSLKETTAEKKPSVPSDIKAKVMNMTLDMVMKLMSSLMNMVASISRPGAQPSYLAPQVGLQPIGLEGVKIVRGKREASRDGNEASKAS